MSVETIITEKMTFGGDCIAKINGKTVFVPYALPAEKLAVEIVREEKSHSIARIVEICTPSPHRVQPTCPLYQICGGCNLQHCDDQFQVQLRKELLCNAFQKEHIPIEKEEIEVVRGSSWGYRARFQFHNGGLMARHTNDVIPLTFCPCATKEINEYLKNTPLTERPRGRVHIFGSENVVSHNGKPTVVIANDSAEEKSAQNKRAEKTKTRSKTPHFSGHHSQHAFPCTIRLLGTEIQFDARGFFQSNIAVLEKAIPLVCPPVQGNHALDLYAGSGTFSTFLAHTNKYVTLVEHNRDALLYAEKNIGQAVLHESFGIRCADWARYHAASAIKRHGAFDSAIVDPPRSGMEKETCAWLGASGITHIRSLSCNAQTHARDAAQLIQSGYTLKKLFLLDFYPQTCHIESLALFET